jgi:ABC-type proline/glycine betaine transport system permease subunit
MTYICALPLGYMSAAFTFLAATAWFVSAAQTLPTIAFAALQVRRFRIGHDAPNVHVVMASPGPSLVKGTFGEFCENSGHAIGPQGRPRLAQQ